VPATASILAVPKRARIQARREVIPEPVRKLVEALLKFFRENPKYEIEALEDSQAEAA